MPHRGIDSAYAWRRLWVSFALMVMGGSGMYVVTVILPILQKEFGTTRAEASIPWMLTMIGFGLGGVLVGWISDRRGIFLPSISGAVCLGLGFIAAAHAQSLWQYALIQALPIAVFGGAASFVPLVADVSHWFKRRRGMAISICISGNLAAGAVWPPIFQHFFDRVGWRTALTWTGVACLVAMLPLALFLGRRSPVGESMPPQPVGSVAGRPLGMSPTSLQALLCVASLMCCVAMGLPQVHIVAYCSDLGYGASSGAQMLSMMLAAGVAGRILCGWLSDSIGGLRTLLLGSVLQCAAMVFFVPFDSVGSLYVVSTLFGFFQGGIVPSYTLIVREFFSPAEAGRRAGAVMLASLSGMGLGGWLGGWIFDLSGSYPAAFMFGLGANALNIAIVAWLLVRAGPCPKRAARYAESSGLAKRPQG